MRGHFLRVLERAALGEVGGDPGGTECVAADFRRDAGRRGAPADHPPGVGLAHRFVGEHGAVVAARGTEEEVLAVLGDAGRVDIGMQRLGERVMAGHGVLLPPFSWSRIVHPAPRGRRSSTFILRAALMRAKL
jgi:hypothetical protein